LYVVTPDRHCPPWDWGDGNWAGGDWGPSDQAEATRLIRQAVDWGINCVTLMQGLLTDKYNTLDDIAGIVCFRDPKTCRYAGESRDVCPRCQDRGSQSF
jgi:hypothetical protein